MTTSSPGELLLMLYDAAIKHGTRAKDCIGRGDKESAHKHLIKAQQIVAELIASLDHSVELAKYLFQLYEYAHHELVEANVRKDAGLVDHALAVLRELRDAWQQALKGAAAEAAVAEIRRRSSYAALGGIELAY